MLGRWRKIRRKDNHHERARQWEKDVPHTLFKKLCKRLKKRVKTAKRFERLLREIHFVTNASIKFFL